MKKSELLRMEFFFTLYVMGSLFSKWWLSPSLVGWSSFPIGWPSSGGLSSSSPELDLLSFFSFSSYNEPYCASLVFFAENHSL